MQKTRRGKGVTKWRSARPWKKKEVGKSREGEAVANGVEGNAKKKSWAPSWSGSHERTVRSQKRGHKNAAHDVKRWRLRPRSASSAGSVLSQQYPPSPHIVAHGELQAHTHLAQQGAVAPLHRQRQEQQRAVVLMQEQLQRQAVTRLQQQMQLPQRRQRPFEVTDTASAVHSRAIDAPLERSARRLCKSEVPRQLHLPTSEPCMANVGFALIPGGSSVQNRVRMKSRFAFANKDSQKIKNKV